MNFHDGTFEYWYVHYAHGDVEITQFSSKDVQNNQLWLVGVVKSPKYFAEHLNSWNASGENDSQSFIAYIVYFTQHAKGDKQQIVQSSHNHPGHTAPCIYCMCRVFWLWYGIKLRNVGLFPPFNGLRYDTLAIGFKGNHFFCASLLNNSYHVYVMNYQLLWAQPNGSTMYDKFANKHKQILSRIHVYFKTI